MTLVADSAEIDEHPVRRRRHSRHGNVFSLLELGMSDWSPIDSAPKDTVLWFWVRPKTEDETYLDTSGKSIFVAGPPRIFQGKYKTWSSLETADYWMHIPWPAAPLAGSPKEQT